MELNLTQSFKRAVDGFNSASTDSGYRHHSGRRGRTRIQFVGTGLPAKREALITQPVATDVHTINCGRELLEGDELVFLDKSYELTSERARFQRVSRMAASYAVASGVVRHIGPATEGRFRSIVIETTDGREITSDLHKLSLSGCWRKPWACEATRDGVLATRIAQDERDIEDQERYSA